MTDDEWKFFGELKELLDRSFARARARGTVRGAERWFMLYKGTPSHRVWTDYPLGLSEPTEQERAIVSQLSAQEREMWELYRPRIKEFLPRRIPGRKLPIVRDGQMRGKLYFRRDRVFLDI
jgi:hypothetical protein